MEMVKIDSVRGTGRDRPLVPLTSTDHDVPYPAGCRRPGNPTRGPKPTSGSRDGEFCTVFVTIWLNPSQNASTQRDSSL